MKDERKDDDDDDEDDDGDDELVHSSAQREGQRSTAITPAVSERKRMNDKRKIGTIIISPPSAGWGNKNGGFYYGRTSDVSIGSSSLDQGCCRIPFYRNKLERVYVRGIYSGFMQDLERICPIFFYQRYAGAGQ